MKRGFTLIELLVVLAVVAISAAIIFPLLAKAKESGKRVSCTENQRQLTLATYLYKSDYSDRYPIAMYAIDGGLRQTWFGIETSLGKWDKLGGLLQPYIATGALQKCPSSAAIPRFGDGSGYGYNWGFIGSDASITFDYSDWPTLHNPAMESELSDLANKVLFADSGFVNPPWYGGDGQVYETGFIDPPQFWYGNPTIEFRHLDSRKKVDLEQQLVQQFGLAVLAFADGHCRPLHPSQVSDAMFSRD